MRGILDTGFWLEHPSFADDGSYGPLPAGSFTGTACEFGTSGDLTDLPFQCNNKIIEASVCSAAALAALGELTGKYDDSARDEYGHGTPTASIAAGNDPFNS